MFDSRYAAFVSISALLVLSPGATLAVVTETALGDGRAAALRTVIGVGIGNATLALASMLGMSVVLHQWPWALEAVRVGGAVYLTYLGSRGLWSAIRGRGLPQERASAGRPLARSAGSHVARGITTNLLNPSVVLFYMTLVPQFIVATDPFVARFLLLGATHVAMSVVWQGSCAMAVGLLAERMTRPAVRRSLEGVTGVVLIWLGLRLILRT